MEEEDKPRVATAESLLDICTQMVATNIDIVESFHGMPSLIGERIFSAGCETERFISDVEYSTQAVRLFTDAYGEEFLSRLNVSGEHLGLNYCLEQILLFTDLVHIDLSHCGLGDDHEMLAQFQHLNRLEVLLLRGNSVSNAGVQKMTAPYRMFQRGPECLTTLDFTHNLVSRQCLKYLTEFESLHTVLFTEVKNRGNGKPSIQHLGNLGCWILSEDETTDYEVQTEGWAKVLIDRWMKEAKLKTVKSKPVSKTGMFSIRKCPAIETSNTLSVTHGAGDQSCCYITARRGYKSAVNTETGGEVPVKTRETVSDTLKDADFEDMIELYKENTKASKGDLSLMQHLEATEQESEENISKSNSNHEHKQTKILFTRNTKVNEKHCKQRVTEKKKVVGNISSKGTRSIKDFMMIKTVKENEKLKGNNASSSRLCTSYPPVSYHSDGITKVEDQSTCVESSQSVTCTSQSGKDSLPSPGLSTAPIGVKCLPSVNSHHAGTLNLSKSLNMKKRKRKITLIKNNHDRSKADSFANDMCESHSDKSSDTSVRQQVTDKENVQCNKRFKSSFLQYLY